MKQLFFIVSFLWALCAGAQKKKEAFYVFNEDGSTAKNVESCYSFMHMTQQDDTTFLCRTYLKEGALLKWETFRDADLNEPHGRFAYYKQGKIDSMGWVFAGKKDKEWLSVFSKLGRPMKVVVYDKGKRLYVKDYEQKRIFYNDGRSEEIVEDSTKKFTPKIIDTPSVKEPTVKGGTNSWAAFLNKNLNFPERILNKYKSWGIKVAKVNVEFTVDTVGNLSDIIIVDSFDWSADTEVLRVMKKSPKWQPALLNGKPINYRHRQQVSFSILEN